MDHSLKQENQIKKYKGHFHEALSRMFPSAESLDEFKKERIDEGESTLRQLASIGASCGYLAEQTESELVHLINTMAQIKPALHHGRIPFEDMLNQITQGSSFNSLIDWINDISEDLDFPKVQVSLITRMKQGGILKTTKQKWILRLLAFWVGLKRPHLPYDYRSFIESFGYIPETVSHSEEEGVRIDFTFAQTHEIIDFQMIDWLKHELLICIKDLNLYRMTGDKVHFYSTTTATLLIDKDKGPANEPRLYSQAVRCALVIAHQILVRWALSPLNKYHNPMIIGIASGQFKKLQWQMQALINARLEENFNIRLTDFSKLCACLTDTKIVFSPSPSSCSMMNGENLILWTVRHFWFLYYDFIPKMIEDGMFPSDEPSRIDFSRQTQFPDRQKDAPGNLILDAIRKAPQNDSLIIETALVCLSKRMYIDACTILSIIFASDPFNPVARTLKMLIFLNMAMNQPDYGLFELYFDRAKKEGDFALKYCREEEELWCEYGLLFWTRAIYILRMLRKKKVVDTLQRNTFKSLLLDDLKQAETCFQNGMIFSPTVNRPGFWIVHLRSLIGMIGNDPSITESTGEIKDRQGIYGVESMKFFISLGWLDPAVITMTDETDRLNHLNRFVERMTQSIGWYYGSVHLRMYKPNVAFSIATVLWDFCPMITVKIAKNVLTWLERSKFNASQVIGSHTGLFSIVAWYSQIQDPKHFIACVDRAMDKIKSIIQKYLHLHDDTVIDQNSINGFRLFPLFFDE